MENDESRNCVCAICLHYNEFQKRMQDVPEEHRAFFDDLYERYTHADFDNQWYRIQEAQAIEARSGETERLDPKGESAVGNADASKE